VSCGRESRGDTEARLLSAISRKLLIALIRRAGRRQIILEPRWEVRRMLTAMRRGHRSRFAEAHQELHLHATGL